MARAKPRYQDGLFSKLVQLLWATFPHIVLIVSYLAYLILGSFSFCYLEEHFGQSDVQTYNDQMNDTRTDIMEMLSNSTSEEDKQKDKLQEVNRLLDKLEEDSSRPEWKAGRVMSARVNRTWTFSSSMLFCMTTITTIGYGDIVPTSKPGRTFCVIYALIGIPFTLLLLADVGDLLARVVIWSCRKLGVHNCSRRLRTQCSRLKPSQTCIDNCRPNEQSRAENGPKNDKKMTTHDNMAFIGNLVVGKQNRRRRYRTFSGITDKCKDGKGGLRKRNCAALLTIRQHLSHELRYNSQRIMMTAFDVLKNEHNQTGEKQSPDQTTELMVKLYTKLIAKILRAIGGFLLWSTCLKILWLCPVFAHNTEDITESNLSKNFFQALKLLWDF